MEAEVGIVVGVDWGDRKHAYVVREGEEELAHGFVDAEPEALHDWVRAIRALQPVGRIAIAVEQSRGAFIYALLHYEFIDIVPINPRAAKAYRDSLYLSGAKDDPVDARLLCDFVRAHRSRLRVWKPEDQTTRKLQLLIEGRRALVESRTATTQALTATLKKYFPQISTWFGGVESRLARAFLMRWPTLDAARSARRDAIVELVRRNGRRTATKIDELVTAIRSAVALTDDQGIVDSLSLLALGYVQMLNALEEAIGNHDKAIAACWKNHPDRDLFDSFDGAGPVMAPRLAVAFGMDRNRYEDARELQQYSGIAPVVERSGRQQWTHARYHCPKFLRQTFHEFAAASIPHSAWARAFYQMHRDKGAGHHAAVRALAYRWIRILFACWMTKTKYDESTYVQSLKRRNSPLAARLAA